MSIVAAPTANPYRRRLAAFVAGLAVLLVALELAVRRWEPLFEAASHRALTKVAMCERHEKCHADAALAGKEDRCHD